MSGPVINTICGPFSKEPEHLELNKCFVGSIVPRLKGLDYIVDLACGTGTLTELLLTKLRGRVAEQGRWVAGPKAVNGLKIIGIDISRGSLKLAQDQFAEHGLPAPPGTESSGREATTGS
jgi:SAM-dependent methyltransferase